MAKSIVRPIVRAQSGEWSEVSDHIATEAPLEIRLNGTPLAVLMRTPGDEKDLIMGFAITEGMVIHPHEIEDIVPVPQDPDDNRWELVLAEGVDIDPGQFQRNTYTTSSCGVCGKASIDAVRVTAPDLPKGPQISGEVLLGITATMRGNQETFDVTGGLHAAAAFTPDGGLVTLREDIGRHNAVDKLVGALATQRWPLGELILGVSGRVSFEMVQKCAVAGLPVIAGVSAASSLAVELAEELGVTVVGFLRESSFNIYHDPGRLISPN